MRCEDLYADQIKQEKESNAGITGFFSQEFLPKNNRGMVYVCPDPKDAQIEILNSFEIDE